MKRLAACVLMMTLLGSAHAGKRVLPIALVLNGTRLSVNPPPIFYKDHLLVPVRRILNALGLDFEKEGRYVRTYAGAKAIQLVVGSRVAQVDNQPVVLDAAPVEINNTLYAPLRFFTEALQAQAVYVRQTNSVELISTLVGRSGNGIVNNVDGEVELMGTITQIDLTSDPATITLTSSASVRTLQITPDVSVIVQDVDAGTSTAGDLAQVHAGDYAHVYLTRQGRAKRIVDAYGSRTGTIAAIAGDQIVLDDGHVIVPVRTTTVALNGATAAVGDLRVGDVLMVRYNIDSSEPLVLQASRTSGVTPAVQQGGSAIKNIDVQPLRPLRAGDVLQVTMRGTPEGTASFDIGSYVKDVPLTQSAPGVYKGTYTVARGVNFPAAPILGNLQTASGAAAQIVSQATVSVSTQAPGIDDVAPDNGAVVNSPRPSIYATFVRGAVDVNPSSERIEVNGHDVTASSLRTPRFIEYTPGIDYRRGPMHVSVRVADAAGNVAVKSWTFFIGTK
jgi:hypothetical protein